LIIIGYLNVVVEETIELEVAGAFELGKGNQRERLIEFCESQNLNVKK